MWWKACACALGRNLADALSRIVKRWFGFGGAFSVDFVLIGEANCYAFSHQHHGTSVPVAVVVDSMGSIDPPLYGCEVVR